MKSVYIASPYTKPEGKQEENTLKSFEVFNYLLNVGFMPFAPLTSHYIHKEYPQSWQKWMDVDLYWLSKCDYVLRLPGESKGADIEVDEATELGIPVFYNVADLINYQGE